MKFEESHGSGCYIVKMSILFGRTEGRTLANFSLPSGYRLINLRSQRLYHGVVWSRIFHITFNMGFGTVLCYEAVGILNNSRLDGCMIKIQLPIVRRSTRLPTHYRA